MRELPEFQLNRRVCEVSVSKDRHQEGHVVQSEHKEGAVSIYLGAGNTVVPSEDHRESGSLMKLGKQAEESTGGILEELDQNKGDSEGMCIENRKQGSWKRKPRVSKVIKGKENAPDRELTKAGLGSKRGFLFMDDDGVQAEVA